MLDRAMRGGLAYPAINVTSSQTLNAALQGFADADSDGIIQVSLGTALLSVRKHGSEPLRGVEGALTVSVPHEAWGILIE